MIQKFSCCLERGCISSTLGSLFRRRQVLWKRSFSSVSGIAASGISGNSGLQQRKLVPFRTISKNDLGLSILDSSDSNAKGPFKTAHQILAKRVLVTKVLSLSSSAVGMAMVPVLTNYLWNTAVQFPSVMAVAVVANTFLALLSLTPFLLQFLVKRFIVNIYYNPDTKMFTTVHYGFWLNKKALRFFADDLIDASVAPEMKKLWFPLATVFVNGRPLLLSLNVDSYSNKEAFLSLTKNVKIPQGSD